MTDVVRHYAKPDPDLVAKFRGLGAATVYEAAGQKGKMDPAIRPVYQGATLLGTAVTVECHVGDNLMLHKAVTVAGPGDVLVASMGNHTEAGAWGEILATAAQVRGIVGFVGDGGVRDIDTFIRDDFPVFSRSISVGATMKKNKGTINHPIVCGNVRVNPGDIVIGDADGVVIVSKEEAEEVLKESIAREEAEAELLKKLKAGSTTLELLDLEKVLEQLGLTEEEE